MSEVPPTDSPPESPAGPRTDVVARRGGVAGPILVALLVLGLMVLWAVTFAGREWRTPAAWLAFLVTLLPFLYAALATGAFAAWVLAPDRRDIPLVMLAILGSGALLWGPSWPSWGQAAEGDPVRVMEWNVRRLYGGPEDGGDAAACVRGVLDEVRPDVLVLLEVTASDLAAIVPHHACVQSGYWGGDRSGLAVCSRTRSVRGGGQRYVDGDEWRYVLAEIGDGPGWFNVLAVHLHPYGFNPGSLSNPGRLAGEAERVVKAQGEQANALVGRVEKLKDPTLVVGDFNSVRDAALHRDLRRSLDDAWEVGGRGFGPTYDLMGWIPLRIDYVYATDAFSISTADVPDVGCSDHRPVVVDAVLRR